MSTQGQGDGGVYFSTLGPCSYGLGTYEYEENLIRDCFGVERLEEYKGQGRLSAVIVSACHPALLQPAPGGRDRAKVVSKSDFSAFSLPHLDGNYFLRPDRILGVFYIDPNEQPRSGASNVSNPLISREREYDAEGIDHINLSLEKQTSVYSQVMEISSYLLLGESEGSFNLGGNKIIHSDEEDIDDDIEEGDIYGIDTSDDNRFSLNLKSHEQDIQTRNGQSQTRSGQTSLSRPVSESSFQSLIQSSSSTSKKPKDDFSNARATSLRNGGLGGKGWSALKNKVKQKTYLQQQEEQEQDKDIRSNERTRSTSMQAPSTLRSSTDNALFLVGHRQQRVGSDNDSGSIEHLRYSTSSLSSTPPVHVSPPQPPPSSLPPPPPRPLGTPSSQTHSLPQHQDELDESDDDPDSTML
mmetsp:Transcript_33577/g.39454  ORF Transcript_33577/g.39454 Transcript_33577/m.39454 type:complete len:411 (+) Transcript_33577:2-1234(+)